MSDFEETFEKLRTTMLAAAPDQLVAADKPGELVLHTHETDDQSGKPVWFGAVTIKRSYVAYHLFPL